jgi:hypothetical protein
LVLVNKGPNQGDGGLRIFFHYPMTGLWYHTFFYVACCKTHDLRHCTAKIFRLPARGQLGDCFNLRRARYRLLTSLDAMPAVFPSAQCPASTRRISANRA